MCAHVRTYTRRHAHMHVRDMQQWDNKSGIRVFFFFTATVEKLSALWEQKG